MLANLLPGFRDFRTPLVTGYVWLIGLWILIGMPVPSTDEKNGIIGVVNGLGKFLTPGLSVIVLTSAAYVTGILMLPELRRVLEVGAMREHKVRTFLFSWLKSRRWKWLLPRFLRGRIRAADKYAKAPGMTDRAEDTLYDAAINAVYTAGNNNKDYSVVLAHYAWLDPPSFGKGANDKDYSDLTDAVVRELKEEALSLSASLQAANERVFNNFDRARSEGEFRLSLYRPVLFVSLALAWHLRDNVVAAASQLIVALIVCIVLYIKGLEKMYESTEIAAAAIAAGVVKSKTLARFDELVPLKVAKKGFWPFKKRG